MYRLNNGSFLSVSCNDGVESELGQFLDLITQNQAHPVENTSNKQIYEIQMKTTGEWIHDSFTEMYVDMSQSNPNKILKDAWEATNTFIEPKIPFEKFCKSHRVVRGKL